jgi:hypothetical protein
MKRAAILLAAAVGLLLAGAALGRGQPRRAITTSAYDLSWWTVDGGGGASSGDGYTLMGTAGQPDAAVLTGGEYALLGGFWGGAAAGEYRVYLPLMLRNV